jgi:isoleucyl-tRNA synthetase
VASEGGITVALDVTITDELYNEGLARELVNRIQNLRKDSGLEVTDRILVQVKSTPQIAQSVADNLGYICAETLAERLDLVAHLSPSESIPLELLEGITTEITLTRVN